MDTPSSTIDSLTILTCRGNDKKATKEVFMHSDGNIEKLSFSAGKFFTHEERSVSCLNDLSETLEDLLDKPEKFVIRGAAKESEEKIVQRKIHDPNAAFDALPRHYVMLDIDKRPCPAYFDPVKKPEEIVRWIKDGLPEPFNKTSCYYKFSSSQNVPESAGGAPPQEISTHLWFWCDRPVSEGEWKRFFKANPAPVDYAIFSPVQIHYTARPIFHGMDDPLPKRSGIFKDDYDVLPVPPIPAPEERKPAQRTKDAPEVNEESRKQALGLLLPYYKEGVRDRFSGAIAGVLYRGGWETENAADFVHELANLANDPDSIARYDGALRICHAIDNGRPAQGIPVLRKEIRIENLDEILTLLGVGKPNIKKAVSNLLGVVDIARIRDVVKMLVPLSIPEQKSFLGQIQTVTGQSKATLNELLKEARKESGGPLPMDWPDYMMECFLEDRFERGQNLLRAASGGYWQYNGRYWESVPEDFIVKEMLPYARSAVAESEGAREASSLINAALNILKGRVYRTDDPMRLLDSDAPAVINCRNGELWFDENGDPTLKPHRAESYLRHCLNVDYDPQATSPMFDKAVLEIFSKSTDPESMFRHFMELTGYICQPWRKLAIIVLLYGRGNNGKTSLVKMIIRLLGEKMVMSDRISEIETSVFKVGSLDGKLMLLDDDVDEGTCLPDGFLKKISEEKIMTGQHKYGRPFEFTCRTVPVMLANTYPAIKDLSEGIRRRVMAIPFSRKFEPGEVKVGLFEAIWEKEAPGILNQAIAGFQRLKKRGNFEEPDDCLYAKREWLIRSNVLPAFIEDACEKGEGRKQYLKDFYAAFKDYCNEAGIRNVPSRSGVEKRLESLGYRITILNGQKVVRGIRCPTSHPFPHSNDRGVDLELKKEGAKGKI